MLDFHEFQRSGRVWLREALDPVSLAGCESVSRFGDEPGHRLDYPAALAPFLGRESQIGRFVRQLGVDPTPVRIVSFNKTTEVNWTVPWHQDRVIAVCNQRDAPFYENWSRKESYWHCEPPLSVLNHMLFVRIHFDRSHSRNGTLELALGSHQHGKIAAEKAHEIAAVSEIEVCEANPGDVLVAHALLLHRSRSSASEERRRAVRVDYARRAELDAQLEWAIN